MKNILKICVAELVQILMEHIKMYKYLIVAIFLIITVIFYWQYYIIFSIAYITFKICKELEKWWTKLKNLV